VLGFPVQFLDGIVAKHVAPTWWGHQLPDVRMATIFVKSVNTLNETGSWYSPLSFLWKVNLVSSVNLSGTPVTGFRLYFLMKGTMLLYCSHDSFT
jgi:hypothetical protein